jgi:beta-galactosidase
MMKQGPRLNFFRPPTENDIRDRNGYRIWEKAGLDQLEQTAQKPELKNQADGSLLLIFPVALKSPSSEFSAVVQYHIFGDGTFNISSEVNLPNSIAAVAKVGLQMKMKRSYNEVNWYGLGGVSTYPDRKSGGKFDFYSTTAEALYDHNIVIPQDNCNQSGVRWASVSNREGNGFLLTGTTEMNFSAYPYDDAEITKARHLNELDEADFVTVNFDALVTGLGTATCGPGILPQYVATSGIYRFDVTYSPVQFQQKSIFEYAAEKYPVTELLLAQSPVLEQNEDGVVSISSAENADLFYSVNDAKFKAYKKPFDLKKGGKVAVYAQVKGKMNSNQVIRYFEMSKEKWTATADCSYRGNEPEMAIDNNPETIWHSDWSDEKLVQPHFLQVDMGEVLELKGFSYLPRQDSWNGRIATYNFEVSADGENWETVVENGRFAYSDDRQEKMFDKTYKVRYMRITTLREVRRSFYSSIAELGVIL